LAQEPSPTDAPKPDRDHSLSEYLSRRRKMSDQEAHREENHPVPLSPTSGVRAFWGDGLFIDTQDGLDNVLALLRAAGTFAYDSEFMGEQTYSPQLCLIQVATADALWLIDPQVGLDLTAFWELLADPSVLKISHAGQPDYEPLLRHLGKPPANALDTQIAAGFLGMGYPIGLDKLVLATSGVALQKAPKFSQWDRRPLTAVQLRYAADDVRYLIHAADVFQEKLTALGRLSWAIKESETQLGSVTSDPLRALTKMRPAVKMPQPSYSTLVGLLRWRDALARKRNLPVRMIAPDDALVQIAQEMPTQAMALGAIRGLPRRIKEEGAQDVLDIVREGKKNPISTDPALRAAHERSRDRDTIDNFCNAMRQACTGLNIESTLAFSRRDMVRVYNAQVRGLPDVENRLAQGWRAQCFSDVIAPLVAKAIDRRTRRKAPSGMLFPLAESDADSQDD
jgi:ribonuclease D